MQKARLKRIAIIVFFAVGAISILSIRANLLKPKPKYNLILISVDTLRADHMGVYGYPKNTTPNIDKWAKSATIYKNAYTVYPLTFHSFYTLFTGSDDVLDSEDLKYNFSNIDSKAKNIQTLTKILKRNHFLTAAFVTNPIVGDYNKFFREGFDSFSYINTSKDNGHDKEIENSNILTEKVKDWISQNKRQQFFLWAHYTNPHMPYNPTLFYLCRITKDCKNKDYESIIKDNQKSIDGFVQNNNLKSCLGETSQKTIEKAIDLYDAKILSVDDEFGELMTFLKKMKIYDKTIIIFYGDHGEGFDHDIFGHGNSLYNSNIRIPLMIKFPFSKNGNSMNNLISNVNIAGIIYDFLKINHSNTKIKSNKYIFVTTPVNQSNRFAVVTEDYKYIASYKSICLYKNYQEELYDLKKDQNEENNLIEKLPNKKEEFLLLIKASGLEKSRREKTKDGPDRNNIERLKSLGY